MGDVSFIESKSNQDDLYVVLSKMQLSKFSRVQGRTWAEQKIIKITKRSVAIRKENLYYNKKDIAS